MIFLGSQNPKTLLWSGGQKFTSNSSPSTRNHLLPLIEGLSGAHTKNQYGSTFTLEQSASSTGSAFQKTAWMEDARERKRGSSAELSMAMTMSVTNTSIALKQKIPKASQSASAHPFQKRVNPALQDVCQG